MPGRDDVELGTEPHEEKDPADITAGSHRSNAELGTAGMSNGVSGLGTCVLQNRLHLGCPLGTHLGV